MKTPRSLFVVSLAGIVAHSAAFQTPLAPFPRATRGTDFVTKGWRALTLGDSTTGLGAGAGGEAEAYLAANHPSFSRLLSKSGDVAKKVFRSEGGFTVFAPGEPAFDSLGGKRREQLEDVRNGEVAEKIASYHVIAEPVTADQLFNSGGVVTLGGEVLAERSVSGGFFGVGGKEDGGVTLNGARVVKSVDFSDEDSTAGVVHEVDGFVSPSILWRYADQLRIPGSQ